MPDATKPNPASVLDDFDRVRFVMKKDSVTIELAAEPLDPNEIRIALEELHNLMSRIRSAAICRDLKSAYDRIAGISVRERTLDSRPSETRAVG